MSQTIGFLQETDYIEYPTGLFCHVYIYISNEWVATWDNKMS